MAKRFLMAVGAHADDIELNAGGTLVKYHEDYGYDIVYVMSTNNMSGGWSRILPDGTRSSRTPPYDEIMPQRKLETAAAAKVFGTEAIHLNHPQRHYMSKTGKLVELRYGNECPDCVPPDTPTIITAHEHKECVQKLADIIIQHQPEAIMTHGPIMVDMEHIGTCLLVTKAYHQALQNGYAGMLLHWLHVEPTIYSKVFDSWETFIDVSKYWEEKLHAISLHACQMPDPLRLNFQPWGKECGCRHAEVFTVGGLGKTSASSEFTSEVLKNRKA